MGHTRIEIFCLQLILALVVGGCGGRVSRRAPCSACGPSELELRQGEVVDATFAAPVDDAAVGTRWQGVEALGVSVLRRMSERAVIIKADDLRVPISAGFARFFSLVATRHLPASVGLITNGLASDPPAADVEFLSRLDARVTEIWFHGVTHELSETRAEFIGYDLETQAEHFRMGLQAGRDVLDIAMTSFGAPGNGTDDNTILALQRFPEIEAVFFVPDMSDRLVLPHLIDIEGPVGVVVPLADFASRFEALSAQDPSPAVLQVHPAVWSDESWSRFEQILDYLAGTMGMRFTTARAFGRWQADAGALVIEKIGPEAYRLDGRALKFDHLIDFGDLGVVAR